MTTKEKKEAAELIKVIKAIIKAQDTLHKCSYYQQELNEDNEPLLNELTNLNYQINETIREFERKYK
jgi:hypothetical protein